MIRVRNDEPRLLIMGDGTGGNLGTMLYPCTPENPRYATDEGMDEVRRARFLAAAKRQVEKGRRVVILEDEQYLTSQELQAKAKAAKELADSKSEKDEARKRVEAATARKLAAQTQADAEAEAEAILKSDTGSRRGK